MTPLVDILLGPTASGKTALAIEAARLRPTVIINVDAMQMYRPLRVLSARPSDEDLGEAEHALYGVWEGDFHGSAMLWLEAAIPAIRAAWTQGKRPLLVGGTGLYARALMQGFSPVPPIGEEVRQHVRLLEEVGRTNGVREALQREDPRMATMLRPSDTQRMMRALEVIRETGVSLAEWQKKPPIPPLPEAEFRVFALMPERAGLYAKINARFVAMMEEGALEEAESVRHLPRHLPMMQSHGLPELLAHLDGVMSLDEAILRAQRHTRNYAKRQTTWIRNQCTGCMDAAALLAEHA